MTNQQPVVPNNKNKTQPSQIKEGEQITPERVYKNFREWKELGKQDPTEPGIQPQTIQPQKGDKGPKQSTQ